VLAIGAEAANIREVPWMAALYTLKIQAEYKPNQWLSFKCGGSLISTRFVLTGKTTTLHYYNWLNILFGFERLNISELFLIN